MPVTKIKYRLWVEIGDEPYLGAGRVELLEHIMDTGSISKAAKKMQMSYRKAWELVRSMNNLGKKPLVEKHPGGKSGGGANVTLAGQAAIRKFRKLQKRIEKTVAGLDISV